MLSPALEAHHSYQLTPLSITAHAYILRPGDPHYAAHKAARMSRYVPVPLWIRRPGQSVPLHKLTLTAVAIKHRLLRSTSKLTRLLTHKPAARSLADHAVEIHCSLQPLALGRSPAARLLWLDVPDPELGSSARSNLPLVRDVARTLMFAPDVRALADRVVAGISGGGGGGGGAGAPRAYNSVHLRLEKDARDWSIIMGGQAVRPLPRHMCCRLSWHQHAGMGGAPGACVGRAMQPSPCRPGPGAGRGCMHGRCAGICCRTAQGATVHATPAGCGMSGRGCNLHLRRDLL